MRKQEIALASQSTKVDDMVISAPAKIVIDMINEKGQWLLRARLANPRAKFWVRVGRDIPQHTRTARLHMLQRIRELMAQYVGGELGERLLNCLLITEGNNDGSVAPSVLYGYVMERETLNQLEKWASNAYTQMTGAANEKV